MSGKKELTKAFNKERFRFGADAISTAGIGATIGFLAYIGADPETIVTMMMLGAVAITATLHQQSRMMDAEAELKAHIRENEPNGPE